MTNATTNVDLITTTNSQVFNMNVESRQVHNVKTCEQCRSSHTRCTYQPGMTTCDRCLRAGRPCVQRSKKIRFRKTWVPNTDRSHKSKSDRQRNLKPARPASTNDDTVKELADDDNDVMVDTIDTLNYIPEDDIDHTVRTEINWPDDEDSIQRSVNNATQSGTSRTEHIEPTNEQSSMASGVSAARSITSHFYPDEDRETSERTFDGPDYFEMPGNLQSLSDTNYSRPSPPEFFLDDLVKAPRRGITCDSAKALEIHLLRYFVQKLAPWFDICDPYRHFAHVLPQRARESGPLRSALLTIAARDLSRAKTVYPPIEIGQWRQEWLVDVTEELAMSYHNVCIHELLSLSLKPERLHDDSLLAAIILLRTDEEMLHVEKDQQLFLGIARLFIDAQLPSSLEILRNSPESHPISRVDSMVADSPVMGDHALNSDSLRQACFWTALRQDLHAAFLKQQPVSFPLKRCDNFRLLHSASDAVWAHRMVVFCADVLEYCFGSESVDGKVSPSYMNRTRWQKLQSHKQEMCALLPPSFEPVYCCEPDHSQGELFPNVFYLEPCHVSGATYIELATMLLETYDPVRSKLGGGLLRPSRAFLKSIKKILYRLCGIAVSNAHLCPPGLVNASLAIGLFGEYFEDFREQNALLGVLSLMAQTFNYHPAIQIAKLLRHTWFEGSDEEPSPTTAATATSSMHLEEEI